MDKSLNGTERVFVDCLREIERSYLNLSKQLRIRVEKWVEKLVTTGNNAVWVKHRNAYAKLLLSMVISRNMTDPFHILPPDGPLPSYPFHLKSFSKNSVGPHESMFWHDLYNRANDSGSRENEISKNTNIKGIMTTLPQSREIGNLNLLIKEQARRIQILEEQLHNERVQHELQIQRIHYTHRIDLTAALRNNQNNTSTHENSFSKDLDLSRASPLKTTASLPNFLQSVPLLPAAPSSNRKFDAMSSSYRFRFEPSSAQKHSFDLHQRQIDSDILPTPGNANNHNINGAPSLTVTDSVTLVPRGHSHHSSVALFPSDSHHGNDSDGDDSNDNFMSSIENFQEEIDKIKRTLGAGMTSGVFSSHSASDYQEVQEENESHQMQSQQNSNSSYRLSRSEFSD